MNSAKLQDPKSTYANQLAVFLCTNNEQSEGEVKGKRPFTLESQRKKMFRSKVNHACERLAYWNYKTAELRNIHPQKHSVFMGEKTYVKISVLSLKIKRGWGWKYGSMVKNSGCSCKGLGFNSQHPRGGSQHPLLTSAGTAYTAYTQGRQNLRHI